MKAIRNIFVKNEIAKMVRHSKNQFILLCLVFALLIIALNQSIFGLQKINQKYNNPFANYIQVATPKNVDQDREAMVKSIVQKFSSEPLKSRLKIEKVNELHYEFIAFSNPKTGMAKTYKGRTFTEGDQLYKELTGSASENIIQSLKLEKNDVNKQYGIIVTESMVIDLGYDPYTVKMIPMKLEAKEFVLIPVHTVVKNLPQYSDFMVSDDFSYINNQSIDKTNFATLGGSNRYTLMSMLDTAGIIKRAHQILKNIEEEKCTILQIDKNNKLYSCEFTLSDYWSYTDKMDRTSEINNKQVGRDLLFNKYTLDYVETESVKTFTPDYLEFKFASLDSVQVFQQACLQNNLEPDMQIIKSRHLFAEVGAISKILAAGFILFSLLMLFIFTNSFISRHIEEIKPNLGTLLAYGMPGSLIVNNYLTVIFIVYSAAFLVGLVLSLIVSYLLHLIFQVPFIFNYQIPAMLCVAIFITLLYSRSVIIKIFTKTPGDLIYKR